MLSVSAEEFFHPHCGGGCFVLAGLVAGKNRHLPVAGCLGMDCRSRHCRSCRVLLHPSEKALQRHTLLDVEVKARGGVCA